MISDKGIIEHHAVYVKYTVVVTCEAERFEEIYGPQPAWDDYERQEEHEATFDVVSLRVPCKRERISLHVQPADHATKSMHGGSYLCITGYVDIVEHQVYTRAAHGHHLSTTFIYLDTHLMSFKFPEDWVVLT